MKSQISKVSPELQTLYDLAVNARKKSYSPYSGCAVGAALLTTEGKFFSGCNVENSSYGATVCAERVAIQKAVSDAGAIELKELIVVTEASPPWPPCGMCRQVIAEFGANVRIHLANLAGEIESILLKDLFPNAFTPDHLKKK
jgi:cytidine deaminase